MTSQNYQLELNTYSAPSINHILSDHSMSFQLLTQMQKLFVLGYVSFSPSQSGSCHFTYELLQHSPVLSFSGNHLPIFFKFCFYSVVLSPLEANP